MATFLGAQDVEVHDLEFDQEVVVKAKDPAEVMNFLTSKKREWVRFVLTTYRGSVVDQSRITWESEGLKRDPDCLVTTVGHLVDAARQLNAF